MRLEGTLDVPGTSTEGITRIGREEEKDKHEEREERKDGDGTREN